jgi:hypothetical protein
MAGTSFAESMTSAIASAVVELSCQSWRLPMTVPESSCPTSLARWSRRHSLELDVVLRQRSPSSMARGC